MVQEDTPSIATLVGHDLCDSVSSDHGARGLSAEQVVRTTGRSGRSSGLRPVLAAGLTAAVRLVSVENWFSHDWSPKETFLAARHSFGKLRYILFPGAHLLVAMMEE